nr:uncharacterized protein LOC131772285 [Pocillopora verrucosa]
MPWHKGRRRNDSKESEETKGRTEPVTEEPAACEPNGGACGTSADEVGDGNLKSVKRDQRGRIRTKHWRDKKEGFKGQYRCKEGAGKDTAAHQGGARKKTGTGKQFSPPNKATGPSADTIPPKYAEDEEKEGIEFGWSEEKASVLFTKITTNASLKHRQVEFHVDYAKESYERLIQNA